MAVKHSEESNSGRFSCLRSTVHAHHKQSLSPELSDTSSSLSVERCARCVVGTACTSMRKLSHEVNLRFLANPNHVGKLATQSFEAGVEKLRSNPATTGVTQVQMHGLRPNEVTDEASEAVSVVVTDRPCEIECGTGPR